MRDFSKKYWSGTPFEPMNLKSVLKLVKKWAYRAHCVFFVSGTRTVDIASLFSAQRTKKCNKIMILEEQM